MIGEPRRAPPGNGERADYGAILPRLGSPLDALLSPPVSVGQEWNCPLPFGTRTTSTRNTTSISPAHMTDHLFFAK